LTLIKKYQRSNVELTPNVEISGLSLSGPVVLSPTYDHFVMLQFFLHITTKGYF
jgi:hypothetical protein